MAAPKPIYDLVLLLDADAPSERRQEILREVEAFVDRAGTIESKHDWGVRALSYEIQHHKEAEYHLLQFSGPGEMIERLRTMLRITDGVLRHRIIRVLPGTPDPPAMRPEPRRVPEGEGEPVAAAAPAAAAPVAEAATAEAPAAAAEAPAAAAEAPAAAADAPAPAEAPAATAEAPAATPEAPAPAAEAPAAAEDAPPADDAPASA